MKLAIVIPAHNEEKRIENTLIHYLKYFRTIEKSKLLSFSIVVVLNACKDRTPEIVQRYAGKNLEILEFEKGGKGFAVIEGFKHALRKGYDLIGFVDADMATSPEAFYDLVINLEKADGMIASRYVKGSIVEPRNTLPRIMASRLYNSVIRALLLLPYRDTQCGAKVFRHEALRRVINDVGMTQLAFDIELLYKLKKKGFYIKEHPTVWSNKEYSTINFWQSGPWMTLAIVRLRLLNSRMNSLVRIYDKILNKIKKLQRK